MNLKDILNKFLKYVDLFHFQKIFDIQQESLKFLKTLTIVENHVFLKRSESHISKNEICK